MWFSAVRCGWGWGGEGKCGWEGGTHTLIDGLVHAAACLVALLVSAAAAAAGHVFHGVLFDVVHFVGFGRVVRDWG